MYRWTKEDQDAAMAEGWLMADNNVHGMRIERYDDAARFDCDAAAVAYVGLRAHLGERRSLHARAFEFLASMYAVEDAARLDAGED